MLIGETISMPVQIEGATCESLHLSLGAVNEKASRVTDPARSSNDMIIMITSTSIPGQNATDKLCQISRLVSGKGSTSAIVDQLNQLIGVVASAR